MFALRSVQVMKIFQAVLENAEIATRLYIVTSTSSFCPPLPTSDTALYCAYRALFQSMTQRIVYFCSHLAEELHRVREPYRPVLELPALPSGKHSHDSIPVLRTQFRTVNEEVPGPHSTWHDSTNVPLLLPRRTCFAFFFNRDVRTVL